MNRREFLYAGMTAIALSNLAQPQSKTHDMGGMQHPMPERPEDCDAHLPGYGRP